MKFSHTSVKEHPVKLGKETRLQIRDYDVYLTFNRRVHGTKRRLSFFERGFVEEDREPAIISFFRYLTRNNSNSVNIFRSRVSQYLCFTLEMCIIPFQ